MPQTIYCYHCGRRHPREEMRQIETKTGKKWRCIKSIQATKLSITQRDAFGKSITTNKKAENQARIKAGVRVERFTGV
jgi:hypothetical protein